MAIAEFKFLENKPRKRSQKKSKRKASPAQLRARKKFAAMAKARSKAAKKRSAPRKTRSAKRTTIVSHKSTYSQTKGVPMSKKKRQTKRKAGKRRTFRRNPQFVSSLKNTGNNIVNNLKDAAVGAGGIMVNKAIAHQINSLAKIDPKYQGIIKVGTAVVVLPMLAKALPPKYGNMVRMGSKVAAAVAVYELLEEFLPATVTSLLAGEDYAHTPVTWSPQANVVNFPSVYNAN